MDPRLRRKECAVADDDMRPGERAIDWSEVKDASLEFIGEIRTPWMSRAECPRQGMLDGPICEVRVFERWRDALQDIDQFPRLEILYWLHQARRDLVLQCARHDTTPRGTFSLRSPVRPNPIGLSCVSLERREGTTLFVRGLDCLNGTPLLDIKPERALFETPAARIR
jgi:tRNA (adenine37-N6)-methyltransferase